MRKKCIQSRVNVYILASTSVLFTLTTVHVLNLALTDTKRITVLANYERSKSPRSPCYRDEYCALQLVEPTAKVLFEHFGDSLEHVKWRQ